MNLKKIILFGSLTISLVFVFSVANAISGSSLSFMSYVPVFSPELETNPNSTEEKDSLKYPLKERTSDFVTDETPKNPFDLEVPPSIEQNVVYDPETNSYIVSETMGNGQSYRPTTSVSFEDFWEAKQKEMKQGYWLQKANSQNLVNGQGLTPELGINTDFIQRALGGAVDIRPSGSIDMEAGFQKQRIQDPNRTTLQQNPPITPNFDMNINMGLTGKIGDNLKIDFNYNTRSIFDFDNQVKLEYIGDEDEIIQEIRAGDVNFPLPTSLIPGSQRLFGIQAKLKFGRLTVNNVLSQQKSRSRNITLENGAQIQDFQIPINEYDENRHFFLAQYFRNNYEKAVKNLPYINSPVNITRLEVYVSDTRGTAEDVQRDIVGFADLAEKEPFNDAGITGIAGKSLPENGSNDLYQRLISEGDNARLLDQVTNTLESPAKFRLKDVSDFRKTSARKLNESEYTYDPQLGFVSLNFTLRAHEVLAVAYEYTTIFGGVYKVGEFANDVFTVDDENDARVLFLKMLKSTQQIPTHPIWDLMMKNVYNLGAFQIEQQDFRLDVLYESPGGGDLRYLPVGDGIQGVPLIRLLNLDNLNKNNEPRPDGVFDFFPTAKDFENSQQVAANTLRYGTINTQNGRLIFPILEPFGSYLRDKFVENNNNVELANQYVYDELYDSTRFVAGEYPEFNRFFIKGSYKSSSSSEISLGAFNIPQGSVKVTAGGQTLIENQDYEINYGIGRIKILNEAYINGGLPISVSFEDNGAFGIQQRSYMGSRLDYQVNKNFSLGGTFVRLAERPFTQKVNFGDDPIANKMAGLDMNYFTKADWITKAIDKLPLISTKEPSTVTFNAEGAAFIPGHARAIGDDGTVYIDDFDGSKNETPLDQAFQNRWMLASTPRNVPTPSDYTHINSSVLFPEANLNNDLAYGENRAKFSWYNLDPFDLQRNFNSEISQDHYARSILIDEIFPNRFSVIGTNALEPTFDMSYFPNERGPYNFTDELTEDGKLTDPEKRWGGMMRSLTTTNFEQNNVEFIEFWLMDPFLYENQQDNQGDLFIQLGNASEDVLKDSRQFYENSLPSGNEFINNDTTRWGAVPRIRPVVYTFDSDSTARPSQDVGFDGLANDGEQIHYINYLNNIRNKVNAEAYESIFNDPSGDDFYHYIDGAVGDTAQTIPNRYVNFGGPENNSPVQIGSDRVRSATTLPDMEDFNRDNALNDSEEYFQYRIRLRPRDGMQIGRDYYTNFVDPFEPESAQNNLNHPIYGQQTENVRWYYFRIPVQNFSEKVGNVSFRNIQFARVFMTGFSKPVTLRMVNFNLVRNPWRRYTQLLREEGEYLPDDNTDNTFFNLTTVSLEETADRLPIPYVIPPGIERVQIASGTQTNVPQNEQSIAVEVGNLKDGESKGVYKALDLDMRQFKRLQLFTHAESLDNLEICNTTIEDGDVNAFIRLGDDFRNNYYEYEIPLEVTLPNEGNYTQRVVWPEANEMDIRLQDLVDTKINRNLDPNAPVNKVFKRRVVHNVVNNDTVWATIKVVGSPDLGKMKQIMLGVRNPKRNFATQDTDDGTEKCAQVWFNELRLAEFDEKPGWAALARMDVKLADLGNLTLSGNMHTPNFGTLEQRVHERSIDNFYNYDASLNMELGRFLPKKSGVRIPTYAGISQSISTPEYDPYDTDVFLKQNVDSVRRIYGNDSAKIVRKQRQTATTTKSINFTNVRKEKTNPEKKLKPYSVENLSLTYAYTETDSRDPIIESDKVKNHKASLNYGYNAQPVYITPFKKIIKSKSLYLRLIKDFNFNLVPSSLSFRNDFNRQLGVLQLRRLTEGEIPLDPIYDKLFTWDRNYGLKYNPARSITFDFTASNRSVIDEPQNGDTPADTLWANIKRLGRTRNYNQTANLSYNLPLDKIPFLAWTQLRTRYGSGYFWEGKPIELADTLGNVIGNNQNIQINGELNFVKLYNSIPILRQINRPPRKKKKKKKDDKKKNSKATDAKDKGKKKKKNTVSPITRALVRPLLSIRRVSASYSQQSETIIPGFTGNPKYLGMNWANGTPRPGIDYLFGVQPELRTRLESLADEGFISPSLFISDQVRQSRTRNLDIKANLEPFRDLKIDLNMNVSHSFNHAEFFKSDTTGLNGGTPNFRHLAKVDVGSYSVSYFALPTLFDKLDTANISETFRVFERNRINVSQRLGELNDASINEYYDFLNDTVPGELLEDGSTLLYREGYGPYAQDVLLPSFIAAYSKKSIDDVSLNPFTLFPLPNWRVSYNGLSRLPGIKKVLSSINISHGYNSNITVNSYRNNLSFDDRYYDDDIFVDERGLIVDYVTQQQLALGQRRDIDTLTGNFMSYYQIPQMVLSEQLSPLIGIDATWINGISTRFEYKKSRILAMSFQDYQLSETRSEEITVGLGYKLTGLTLPIKVAGKPITLDNDLTFSFDFSFRDNITINYRLDQNTSQATNGAKIIRLAPTIDYVLSNRLRVSLFYERTQTIPATSASVPTTNTRGGVRVNFSL